MQRARRGSLTATGVFCVSFLCADVARAADAAKPQPLARPDAPGPFAVGTTTLEVTGVTWLESWNKNLATDRLAGARVAVGADWKPGWQAEADLELHHARLGQSPDAALLGLSGVVRRRLFPLRRLRAFAEVGLGMSLSTRPVPVRGTTVNFLLQAGGGVVRPLTARTSAVLGIRLWHLSNGGVIRNQRRNPDIEGLGGYVGIQMHFR